MSDPDSDMKNIEERERLSKIDHKQYADRLKELFPLVKEYQKKRIDLIELEYKIEERPGTLKIWKEI